VSVGGAQYARARARAAFLPEGNCVLMAAIAIGARSKFKRAYSPRRRRHAPLLLHRERTNGLRYRLREGKEGSSSSLNRKNLAPEN